MKILKHPVAFILYLWIALTIIIWLATYITMNKGHGIELLGIYWNTPIVLIWYAVAFATFIIIIITIDLIKECTKRKS